MPITSHFVVSSLSNYYCNGSSLPRIRCCFPSWCFVASSYVSITGTNVHLLNLYHILALHHFFSINTLSGEIITYSLSSLPSFDNPFFIVIHQGNEVLNSDINLLFEAPNMYFSLANNLDLD